MKCEAGIHSPYCKGRGVTRDHFTPQCLGLLDDLDWIDDDENFQYLDKHCHTIKDFDTADRLRLRQRQKEGAYISLNEYIDKFTAEFTTEWDEKELASLLKTYCNRPDELAMILEEINFLSPTDLGL